MFPLPDDQTTFYLPCQITSLIFQYLADILVAKFDEV